MKILRVLLLTIALSSVSQAQNIYQLTPLSSFGTRGDGSVRPGDLTWLDTLFNQRGMAYDPFLTNLIVVDTHTGPAASDHGVGNIYVLNGLTGENLDNGSGGNFVLNTNGIDVVGVNQAYPYAPAVADDGVVYVGNQVNNSGNTPFVIYRWESRTSPNPPVIAYSNNLTPFQRYGTSMDIRGAGPSTQIIIGCLANGSSGTNVVIFTTADGTNFVENILGADVAAPNFNDGVAFGPGNTFWGKQIGAPLRFMAFNLAAHTATTVRTFTSGTFPDNDNLGAIAVNNSLNLLVAVEEAGGNVSGGPERIRLYDISNFSNQPPALLDVKTYVPDNQNATAPMGYVDFSGTNVYVQVINNGLYGFGLRLTTPPGPSLTAVPPATNQVVVGRTISMTVAGYPSVQYQWQSNGVNIAGATSGTLTLVNVQPSFAAEYNCVVSNSGGTTNASSRLVVLNPSSFYHLNLLWTAFPGDGQDVGGNHAYIFNGNGAAPGTPNLRSIAYSPLSNHLYAITRSGFGSGPSFSNYVFNVVDAATGNSLYTLKTNGITLGVGNGGIGLSSVVVADDGAIYACNIAPAAGGYINNALDPLRYFRIYRWANANSNTEPVEIFTGDPAIAAGISGATSTNRWGDSLAIRGSGVNTVLILDNNNANVRYVVLLTPSDSTMTNWTANGLHQAITGATIGRSLEYGSGGTSRAGTFWQKRRATALIKSPYDLDSPIDPVPALISTTAFTNALSGATVDSARNLLLGVSTYSTSPTPDTLGLWEVSDINAPLLLAEYNFPVNSGTNHNVNSANAINQTLRSGDKVFSFNAGNGLMAFQIAAGAPTPPVFLTQPQNLRVMEGGSGSLSATVDQQSSFQWQFNNVNIPGATSPSYTLANAQLSQAGPYRVIASNLFGMGTSSVATVSVIRAADEYSLSPIWSVTPTNGNGNVINANGGGSPWQRTMAYNALSNHLYVVSRVSPTSVSNYNIYVLNASDGTLLNTVPATDIYADGAVGEGGVGLVGISVSDDGSIYACNMAPDACGCGPNATPPEASLFRVYRWADGSFTAPPVQIFAGDPAGQTVPIRWGDTLTVRGGGMNTEILLDSTTGFGAILRPTDQYLTNFTSSHFVIGAQSTSIGRSLQHGGSNTVWQKRIGTGLRLSSYNLASQSSATLASYANFPSTLGPVGLRGTSTAADPVMAGIDFNGSASTPDSVALYDLSVPTTPLLIARYAFPTNQQTNPNFIGQALFAGNRVWALDANNGLIGFTIQAPKLTILSSGNNVNLSWTTNVGPMTLQSAPSVSPPVSWTSLGSGTISGDRYVFTDTASGTAKIYRLVK